MSDFERKLEEELEKVEKGIEKELRTIETKIHQHNLFPIAAAGLAVFFLMVSMVVVAPYMFLLDVPPSSRAHEYTPLEARGRELFMSLGCFYCHSQQVRLYDWGFGNLSLEGDYVFDSPHALGTERTGPDLAQIGGMRPSMWHYLHDKDPRSVSPGSIMPNFGFLSDEDISALTAYVQNLGGENLEVGNSTTGGASYHPDVPSPYTNATNQFTPLMMLVLESYDPVNDVYNGSSSAGTQWAAIFDVGKANFTQRCLACHGCSGNSQGPYARHVVTQPANLHERIASFPGDAYHIWRVSEGVPGTAMPAWHLSLNDTQIQTIAIYEMSFVFGSPRTISGDISDAEGDNFAQTVLNTPPINGTMEDFETGKSIFTLYCAQCHGNAGQGDGPASINTLGGYISPVPANFTESGSDFQFYGRYVWKVTEGVETTNMPPWKWALTDDEIYKVIFYVQAFSRANDYNSKWAPQYTDPFARNLKKGVTTGSMVTDPVDLATILAGLALWNLKHRQIMNILRTVKLQTLVRIYALRRRFAWMWTC
jgi:cytochrome c oxidase cbb3-type subunit I/II